MRILAPRPGPGFSVADVHRGWVKALAGAGAQVIDFNHDDRLHFYETALYGKDANLADLDVEVGEAALVLASHSLNSVIYEYQPDVLLVTFGKFLMPFVYQQAQQHGIKVVFHATESPYEDDLQLQMAHVCDLVLLNDPTHLDEFSAITKTVYMPHAYDPTMHHPGDVPEEFRSEFCFVGTAYPSRVKFLEQVDFDGIDVALAGNWPEDAVKDSPLCKFLAHGMDRCCDNDETADLYRGTLVSANLYRNEGESEPGWAVGPREIELAATGTFFLRDQRAEGDALFPMLPTFEGPEEFGQLLRWYLDHPAARISAASQAREAISERTFRNNALRLLELLT